VLGFGRGGCFGALIATNSGDAACFLQPVNRSCFVSGPLVATVNAQAQAILTTMNFVQAVGFDADGNTVNVEFVFKRTALTSRSLLFCLSRSFA
jgi:hypothetical protein